MTQTKIHAERLRRIQSVLRSCVALAIAIAALATPLTGCTSVKPQLKAVKLSSEDKDAIARLMAYNCFIDYDSRKPENENTAIFLTIGQMCGCWKMYVNDQDEEKRKDYYIDDQNYKRDPLKAFDTDDENGITGYAKYDGETVDKLLKGIFNMQPTHDTTPKSFDYDMYYDSLDSGVTLRYYYYKGYYYAEESYGICGNDSYGISFDSVVTDGTNYHIKYRRQYASWLDEKSEINPEPQETHNPIETAYATVRKNKMDGMEYWSIVKLSDKPYVDFSEYSKDKPDNSWKKLYINHINEFNQDSAVSEYALVFIDDDDIPELISESTFTYSGGKVSTVYNGKMTQLDVWTYGVSYIPRQNSLLSGYGHMDEYCDEVYKIEKGRFIKTAGGNYGLDDNSDYGNYSGGEIEDYYTYYWNNKKVSQAQYKMKLNKAFDASIAVSPYANTLSASTAIYRLKNDFYEIYPITNYSSEDYD